MSKALQGFMKANFDFSSMKKDGVYPKEMKHTDYEGQAKIICRFLGLESIYDYGKHEIRCHITYAGERPPSVVNENGELELDTFVTVINENPLHL
jgi:hypothetical protein